MPQTGSRPSRTPKTAEDCTLASYFVRILEDYCTSKDLAIGQLFESCGVDRAVLDDPELRVGYLEFLRLCQSAADTLEDEALGLHLGQMMKPEYLGPYGLALMSSDTPREMLEKASRYSVLAIDTGFNEFEETGEECIRYWRHAFAESVSNSHFLDELVTTSSFVMARAISGQPDLAPRWVSFCGSAPADTSPYADFFGCAVSFDAEEYAVAFDRSILDIPLRHSLPQLRTQLDALCEQLLTNLLQERDPDWLKECRRLIIESLEAGSPELNQVAAELGKAPVTLRLRLAKQGLTFRRLVDDIRQELAISYLQNPDLGLIDIAYLLGFSEQSAFQRAFKRWTGSSPGEFRRMQ